MIQDLKQQKGRPLDRAYLIDAFELCRISARVYARYRWRYSDLLTLRIAMNKYKTVSDYLHRDDEDKSADAVLGRRWELVGELVDKCMPDLTDRQVARLGAQLLWIAEKDTPEKLEADLQRWLHGSNQWSGKQPSVRRRNSLPMSQPQQTLTASSPD